MRYTSGRRGVPDLTGWESGPGRPREAVGLVGERRPVPSADDSGYRVADRDVLSPHYY